MDNLFKKNLVNYGLTEREASVYLTLLELADATANNIAKKTGINRSSMYVILDSLKRHGLVSVSEDSKIQSYVATPPEILLKSINERVHKQEIVRQEISSILPDLKALHKDTVKKPRVRVFEGKEGLISAFEDSLNTRSGLMRVSSRVENLFHIIPPEYFQEYVKKRKERGIRMHGIHPYSNLMRKLAGLDLDKSGFDTPLMIPENKFSLPADFAIYDNTVGYMSPENGGLAILIESKEIADVMKSIFDMAGEEAKRLSKQTKKQKAK